MALISAASREDSGALTPSPKAAVEAKSICASSMLRRPFAKSADGDNLHVGRHDVAGSLDHHGVASAPPGRLDDAARRANQVNLAHFV